MDAHEASGAPTGLAWIDGALRPSAEASVHVFSHAVMRGSSVFDVMRVVEGPEGPSALGLRPHLARLERSMAMMGMEPAATVADLEQAVAEVVAANPGAAIVKTVAAWAEVPTRNLPVTLRPTIVIGAIVPDPLEPSIPPPTPVTLRTAVAPKIPPELLPPALKVAASYTVGVRETLAANAAGYDGIVFRTADGLLAEGSTQSMFVVRDSRLLVPPLDLVLDGITRRLVLDIGAHLGYHAEIRPVTWGEVTTADELFLCSTTGPVSPVSRLDDRDLVAPGPISAAIAADIETMIAGPHPLTQRWLTPLRV